MSNFMRVIVITSIVVTIGVLALAQPMDTTMRAIPTAASESSKKPEQKIGVVDVFKVYKSWDVQKKADAEFQPLRDKLQEQDKQISALKEDLRKQKSVLKPEEIAKREAAIKSAERELRDNIEDLSAKIDKTAEELTKELEINLHKIYTILADQEGYTLILDKRAVRYYRPEMDLTERITNLLNTIASTTGTATDTTKTSMSKPVPAATSSATTATSTGSKKTK
ncbi:MAG: OmpH family outer membrane protein [bacterium]|nr:OmpH family outer membrane protein [bacterium]